MHFTNVADAIAWIHGEGNLRRKGEKHGLDNMRALLRRFGDPQDRLKLIHVAGTNGKGSTCAYLDSALRRNGYKTGLYTSPYLCRYNERIRVDGRCIPDEALCRIASDVYEQVQELAKEEIYSTTFEIGTAVAFLWFAEEQVDIAVIEVGLGGRLDPTNVIRPAVCAIATIGLDHTGVLGNTLAEIAGEKAGIIKPGIPVAVYPLEPEAMPPIERACSERGCELLYSGKLPTRVFAENERGSIYDVELPHLGTLHMDIPLIGHHQIANSRLAACALDLLYAQGFALDRAKVEQGFAETVWAGRLEWVRENVLIDGAHNPQGAQSLADYIRRFFMGRRRVLVTGMMKDKAVTECAGILAGAFDTVIATRVDYPRAASVEEIRDVYTAAGARDVRMAEKIDEAIALAEETAGDGIAVIAGSLYVAGEARIILTGGELL